MCFSIFTVSFSLKRGHFNSYSVEKLVICVRDVTVYRKAVFLDLTITQCLLTTTLSSPLFSGSPKSTTKKNDNEVRKLLLH